MLMHVTAHRGCTETVRESALKANPGEKKSLPYEHKNGDTITVIWWRVLAWYDVSCALLNSELRERIW